MGSSMDCVVSSKYYGLQTLASSANIPVIFVAPPHGYTENSPWRISDNKDHTFFDDILKLFKENICVDTARVFCCGFSYGAMVSYSRSLSYAAINPAAIGLI
jgi:poly(3-hydroxybutyrate) depolymerase